MKKSLLALSLAALVTTAFAGTVYEHKDDKGAAKVAVGGDFRLLATHSQDFGVKVGDTAVKGKTNQDLSARLRLSFKSEYTTTDGLGLAFYARGSYKPWNIARERAVQTDVNTVPEYANWADENNGKTRKVNLDLAYVTAKLGNGAELAYGKQFTAYSSFGDDTNVVGVYAPSFTDSLYKQTVTFTGPQLLPELGLTVSYARSGYDTEATKANETDKTKFDANEGFNLRTQDYAFAGSYNGLSFSYAHTRLTELEDGKAYKTGTSHDASLQFSNDSLVEGLNIGFGVNGGVKFTKYVKDVFTAATANDGTGSTSNAHANGDQVTDYYLTVGAKSGFEVNQYFNPYFGATVSVETSREATVTTAANVTTVTPKSNADKTYKVTFSGYLGTASTVYKYEALSLKVFAEARLDNTLTYVKPHNADKFNDPTKALNAQFAVGAVAKW